MINKLLRIGSLAYTLAQRDFSARNIGSIGGTFWMLLNPLLQLALYSFVFSAVFKVKWPQSGDQNYAFAISAFAGMVVHAYIADVMSRASALIVANPNYVLKVVFPLDSLVISLSLSSFVQYSIGLVALIGSVWFLQGQIQITLLFLPLIMIQAFFLSLGFSYALSAIGVYFRDVSNLVGLLLVGMMFFAPVFYPVESIPAKFQDWIWFNPITPIVLATRDVVVSGKIPSWEILAMGSAWAIASMMIGIVLFRLLRRGFADVL